MMKCRTHLASTLAMLGALGYLVCHFWGLVLPPDVRPFHENMLRISVLGWSGMNVTSFVLGIVQWAIWGWLFGVAFHACAKACARFCAHDHGTGPDEKTMN